MQTSQGYIFCILQHFVTKFCNFTNFNKFFTGIYFFCLNQKKLVWHASCLLTVRPFVMQVYNVRLDEIKVDKSTCMHLVHESKFLSQVHTKLILSGIFILLANVIKWRTCKRLRIVYFWKATLYFCVRVHSFPSVRNTKSPTKLLVWRRLKLLILWTI
jgi:hypothetical protein